MAQRRRAIKKVNAPTGPLTSKERRAVSEIMSMKNALSFRSELEVKYRHGHLTKGVLARLFDRVNKASMHPNRKRAILRALTSYNSLV